jgi:hypothetical protein
MKTINNDQLNKKPKKFETKFQEKSKPNIEKKEKLQHKIFIIKPECES